MTLFLTICFTTFNHFLGLLFTTEIVPQEDLTKLFQPDDPKKYIVETIRRLHEIKKYTNIDFPSIYVAVLEMLPNLETTLKNMLDNFDDESAISKKEKKSQTRSIWKSYTRNARG